eukprot:4704276-Lingulodinium_polyedra.AAC.1
MGRASSNGKNGTNCNSVDPEVPAASPGIRPFFNIDSTLDHFVQCAKQHSMSTCEGMRRNPLASARFHGAEE